MITVGHVKTHNVHPGVGKFLQHWITGRGGTNRTNNLSLSHDNDFFLSNCRDVSLTSLRNAFNAMPSMQVDVARPQKCAIIPNSPCLRYKWITLLSILLTGLVYLIRGGTKF